MKKRLFALWISAILVVAGSLCTASISDTTYVKNDSIPFNSSDTTLYIRAMKYAAVDVYVVPVADSQQDSLVFTIENMSGNPEMNDTMSFLLNKSYKTPLYQLTGLYRVTILQRPDSLIFPKFLNAEIVNFWHMNELQQQVMDYVILQQSSACGAEEQLYVKVNNPKNLPVKYKWTPALGLNNDTIQNPVATILFSGTGQMTYRVTVTIDSATVLSDSVNLNYIPLTGYVGLDKTIACGTSLPFFVSTNYKGKGTLRYKWTPSKGLDNDTIRNPTCSITETTTYKMTVTTPQGCTASDEIQISFRKSDAISVGIVTVNAQKKNVVAWNKPISVTGIKQYNIYKETNVTDVYAKIGSVHGDSLSVFIDSLSNADAKSNRYKISYLNACNAESDLSAYHKTMHLSINKGQGNTYNLIWEPYQGFSVNTYNIYRGSSLNTLGYLDGTSGSSTQFTDLDAPTGDIYYQLEVISPNTVSPSKVVMEPGLMNVPMISYNTSRSNIAARIVSGLSELEIENQMTVLVQPDGDQIELISPLETFKYQIFNMVGQLSAEGANDKLISISSLKSGVHVIQIQVGDKQIQKKFVKK